MKLVDVTTEMCQSGFCMSPAFLSCRADFLLPLLQHVSTNVYFSKKRKGFLLFWLLWLLLVLASVEREIRFP